MKEYTIDSNNNKIRYHDFPGSDTPILFIHGLGCAGSFDYPEVAAQSELLNHRRILIDLLGSGFSDKPDDFEYTINDHVKYLYKFVQDLNLDKFIIFAHSLGGPIGIELADKCKDKVETIILSEANLDKRLGTLRLQVRSLTSLSGLRIQRCCERWCRSQVRFRSLAAGAVV